MYIILLHTHIGLPNTQMDWITKYSWSIAKYLHIFAKYS